MKISSKPSYTHTYIPLNKKINAINLPKDIRLILQKAKIQNLGDLLANIGRNKTGNIGLQTLRIDMSDRRKIYDFLVSQNYISRIDAGIEILGLNLNDTGTLLLKDIRTIGDLQKQTEEDLKNKRIILSEEGKNIIQKKLNI